MSVQDDQVLRLVLGDQLFPLEKLRARPAMNVFMAEDMGLCTTVRHHQQKIVLFLAAMRNYRQSLCADGHNVHYIELDPADASSYEDKLQKVVAASGAKCLEFFEIEDAPMESRIRAFAGKHGLEVRTLPSPMFLTSRESFAGFASGKTFLRMADFYKRQRRELDLLLDDASKPVGGQWSFDEQNRKKLPARLEPPPWPPVTRDPLVDEVIELVEKAFPDHPGRASEFAWPVTRSGALAWLEHFIECRLELFGPYEDAISSRSETVYHSMLSPLINTGLLTPDEIIRRVLDAAASRDIPLNSLEGFIRQVIGWREFVRGVYRNFGEAQATRNFWQHDRELTPAWYAGETGIPVLDDTIRAAQRRGWTHHIPRLMVAGNLMTLCEIHPRSAYRWFMEMYVDSADWVMGPNVYGMGIFSDGGVFATKPYICGSNYLLKMSDYARGDWCDIVDGLYWRFIDKHRDFFSGNPRLGLMVRSLDRISPERLERIFAAAEAFIERVTTPSSS